MRVLDLFSGIGGFSLGLERAGMRTIQFVEIDPFCQAVLAKHWPEVPCHDDIRTFNASAGFADVICGGFPCQDISMAGDRAGLEGARSGLWAEYWRLIRDIRPKFVIVENVSALLSLGMGDVLGSLASIGYDAEWHCIPASAVGAPHIRDRVWIIAYPAQERAIPGLEVLQAQELSRELGRILGGIRFRWLDMPEVCLVDDGLPSRLDEHQALGNAIVPQIAELIGRAIMTPLPGTSVARLSQAAETRVSDAKGFDVRAGG